MRNKGAIRLFAILLTLACAYYLMFTWVAQGIEKDADEYAKAYVSAASEVGMQGIWFKTAQQLRRELDRLLTTPHKESV